ncbi:MAG: L-serine ammonia-lyase, iron-sulfur-dependent, subunit alpha, partial [Clostridiales bacterium]|nr:L-serine ammonia-lyase, iron-sulfur-dependent, subunit alpha [Clostridiales bacterium]
MIKFEAISELVNEAAAQGKLISEIALAQSAINEQVSEPEIYNRMKLAYDVMKESIENGLQENLKSASGLSGGMAGMVKHLVDSGDNISGPFVGELIYRALAVSAYTA